MIKHVRQRHYSVAPKCAPLKEFRLNCKYSTRLEMLGWGKHACLFWIIIKSKKKFISTDTRQMKFKKYVPSLKLFFHFQKSIELLSIRCHCDESFHSGVAFSNALEAFWGSHLQAQALSFIPRHSAFCHFVIFEQSYF